MAIGSLALEVQIEPQRVCRIQDSGAMVTPSPSVNMGLQVFFAGPLGPLGLKWMAFDGIGPLEPRLGHTFW